MTFQVKCKDDLGIKGCDFVASGETPADVLEKLLPHLEEKHHLSMPKAGEILKGAENSLLETDSGEAVETVVRRLREALDIPVSDLPSGPRPIIGRLPNH